MPEYRRFYLPGGTYFFTVVTLHRQPIFTAPQARSLLRQAWLDMSSRYPFHTIAIVLLPDHLHCIWTLPEGDSDYSVRWSEIKRLFSKKYRAVNSLSPNQSDSQAKRSEAGVWQRRFWEHTIRDEADLNRHIEYIHYNPVKHGLVQREVDWKWSSIHQYIKMGYFGEDYANHDDKQV